MWTPKYYCRRHHHHRRVVEGGRLTALHCDACDRSFPVQLSNKAKARRLAAQRMIGVKVVSLKRGSR